MTLPSAKTFKLVLGTLLIAGIVFVSYHVGIKLEREKWLTLENADLRELNREVSRLTQEAKTKQKEYNDDIKAIRSTERSLADARLNAERVRNQIRLAASTATAERLREYAEAAERDIERLEAERSRFGIEAAEAAAAAHATTLIPNYR
jgi:hypothetical protein